MTLPPDFTLRAYRASDAASVVEVINADGQQTLGLQRAVLDQFGQVRLMRYVPARSHKVVALNQQNQIIGYAYLADREQSIVYDTGGAVHPDFWGKGLGTQLVRWAEQQVAVLSPSAPSGIKLVLQANLFENEQRAGRLFGRAGYTQIREWLHLLLSLDAPPPSPTLPDGMTLHPIDLEQDWELIGPAMEEAFSDHWGSIAVPLPPAPQPEPGPVVETPADESYSNSPGFCFMVLAGSVVAGGILCNAKLVERSDTGRIGSIFVRPRYRRLGLGGALMLSAFSAFWQAGLRRIILDTDADSFTHAPKFYNQLGMRVYRREFLYEKAVRAGVEVRRLAV